MESEQPPAEVVYRSSSGKDCFTHALVLESAGIGYEIDSVGGECLLLVAAADMARAKAELDAYAAENRDWPGDAALFPKLAGGWEGVFGYAATLLLVALLRHQQAFGADWFAAGRAHAGLIRQGQWWRAVTALSLHADLSHLVANVVIGGLIGLFAGKLLGSGLAWLSILVGGAVGNLINAWIHQPEHTSVGASTAVFAALGMMAAHSWKRRRHLQTSTLMRWAPLIGGVALLGYLGTGGARTDVAAHVAGFLCGLLLGALYGTLGDRLTLSRGVQCLLGITAIAAVALAWVLASSAYSPQPA